MSEEANELDELSKEIRKVIDANRKFLERVLDDDFDAEDAPEEQDDEGFEEL
ncbi:hypothetical protein [Geobacter pickeringii]|uniref:hypothetical protein n=1 Tax=Geobacter pickeringii TaxID=345632 RepID=UPI000A6D32B4|nr:hypothetical protein [Geobacter pickeringii]